MYIGNVERKNTAALAPMAGVGDRAFREICIEHGAAFVVGEMCSAKGITYGSIKSAELLMTFPTEQPCSIQLFSSEPDVMAKAVYYANKYKPQIIDINMGCPAPKITGGGSGSSLMRNLPLAGEIIKAAVKNTNVPVTVKFRKGWNAESINAVELAKIAEDSGASAVTVHGRTKAQMYAFPVDLDIIKQVKQAVKIPVIGNGGIKDVATAKEMYDTTGCDLVMVGQGALGRPWIFREIEACLNGLPIPPEPSLEEKMQILRKQIHMAADYKNEKIALREARTHAAWYIRGIHGAAAFRRATGELTTLDDLDRFIELILNSSKEESF